MDTLSETVLDGNYRQCFLLDKSCRKMYPIFSAVLRQQRKSDVMTYFGHTARSAIYYKAGSTIIIRTEYNIVHCCRFWNMGCTTPAASFPERPVRGCLASWESFVYSCLSADRSSTNDNMIMIHIYSRQLGVIDIYLLYYYSRKIAPSRHDCKWGMFVNYCGGRNAVSSFPGVSNQRNIFSWVGDCYGIWKTQSRKRMLNNYPHH
jgi:hypothetical protein